MGHLANVLSRCQDQRKGRLVPIEKLVIECFFKKQINIFLRIFFFRLFIFANYEFCTYLPYIYFRECRLKKILHVFTFVKSTKNSRNLRKYMHAKTSTLKVIVQSQGISRLPISLHYTRA